MPDGGRVQVTVRRVVDGPTKNILVKGLQDDRRRHGWREPACPTESLCTWLTRFLKVTLFLFINLLAGCDIRPAVCCISFIKTWEQFLRAP